MRGARPCSPSDNDLTVSPFAPAQKPGQAQTMQTSCCHDTVEEYHGHRHKRRHFRMSYHSSVRKKKGGGPAPVPPLTTISSVAFRTRVCSLNAQPMKTFVAPRVGIRGGGSPYRYSNRPKKTDGGTLLDSTPLVVLHGGDYADIVRSVSFPHRFRYVCV